MWNMSAPLPASRLGILMSTVEPGSLLGPLFMAWNQITQRRGEMETKERRSEYIEKREITENPISSVLAVPGKWDWEAESCTPCLPTGRSARHRWSFHTQRSSVSPHCRQHRDKRWCMNIKKCLLKCQRSLIKISGFCHVISWTAEFSLAVKIWVRCVQHTHSSLSDVRVLADSGCFTSLSLLLCEAELR